MSPVNDLQTLAESENEDEELVPEILPVDARLSIRGPAETFQRLFERAAAVSPTKEIISGTGMALLEAVSAEGNSLPYVRLTATDGDLTLVMVSDLTDVIMPGKVLVPSHKISQVLKLAPSKQIRLEVLGNTIIIRSGRAQWTVQTVVGDSLPVAADVSGVSTHDVPVAGFLEAMGAARKAASSTTARVALMQLSVSDGCLTGIDGGRMHRKTADGLPKSLNLTIPLPVVEELTKMLRGTDLAKFKIGGNSSHLLFEVGNDTLVAQRSLVAFPDISNQLLGPLLTNVHTMTLDRVALLDAIKRVRVNADQDYQSIFLALVPGKATAEGKTWSLTVSAKDRSGNAAQESLPVTWVGSSGNRTLCVNHRYLTDMLTTLSDEMVTLRIGDDTKDIRLPVLVEDQVSGFTGWVTQMRSAY